MQPAVASLHLAVLVFAVPAHGGVYAPSLPGNFAKFAGPESDDGLIVFQVTGDEITSSSCHDDPTWKDQDGDGCDAYALAISQGHLSQEVACGVVSPDVNPGGPEFSGDFEGAAIHCRATCGTCPAEPDEVSRTVDPSCVDDPTWKDEDGDGCEVYALNIANGLISQDIACGFQAAKDILSSGNPEEAAKFCPATCGICGEQDGPLLNIAKQIVNESPLYEQVQADSMTKRSSDTGASCMDDLSWVDMDGDGCRAYAAAIAEGAMRQEQACGREHVSHLESGNPGDAAKYCPVTCGTCPLEGFVEENDIEMKDMIRMMVEQQSDIILQEAINKKPEEQEVAEVTTTTTTKEKEMDVPKPTTNATWSVYWAPQEEEESLSGDDLLNMAPMPKQSGFKQLF